jgi:hypothetical protein
MKFNARIWLPIIFASITSLYGLYSFLSKNIINNERRSQIDIYLTASVDRLLHLDSLSLTKSNGIIDTLKVITYKQNILIDQMKALNTSYKEHLQISKNINELLRFYELQNLHRYAKIISTDSIISLYPWYSRDVLCQSFR